VRPKTLARTAIDDPSQIGVTARIEICTASHWRHVSGRTLSRTVAIRNARRHIG
jgi:hypothetical protein